ncbi:MAG: indolepyruvate oxidoreductase subunit beta [Methanoregulaceae archaeon]|jgi:indolepyruvate ferredoxin oxidoreductase beta subunit|nr:indolepyruvate oxidoreductase subunit beta [Methanoregulaceae archaeon]
MSPGYDVLVVGIGGQGTILASNVLGEACLIEGRPVKGAETHGMAQRGGSVESHIRIDGEYGPLITPGSADIIISFDLLEALRYKHYVRPGGKIVANRHFVVPTSVFVQGAAAPTEEEIRARLGDVGLCLLDAEAMAAEAGSPLAANIVMLGAASHFLPLSPDSLRKAVEKLVPQKTVGINRKAFDLGREAGAGCLE